MSWTSIDQDLCTQCGICVTRCLMNYKEVEGVITSSASMATCNLCGHCMSLCPTDAISHSLMDMNNFIKIEEEVDYNPDEFIQFIRRRRSHRSFKEKEVPREDLEKLVEMCRYIPTGSNLQTAEIKVISNKDKIKQLSDLTVDYFMGMISKVEGQVKQYLSEGKELPKELEEMNDFVKRYRLMGTARELDLDPILHKAPVLMVFHSAPSPSTPRDDCVIAAQTVVLAAMTMGLGTCYIGLFCFSANSSTPVKDALNIPAGNKVYSVLVMGYPKLKFLKTVDRKPMKVQWET